MLNVESHITMYYHVWFGTKHRRRLLIGEIGPFVETTFKEIASARELNLVECKCFVDHAHMLIEVPDRSSLSKAMQLMKGGSAYRTFRQYPELKMDGHTIHLWREGYGFREVPSPQIKTVRRYIRTQQQRPEKFEW